MRTPKSTLKSTSTSQALSSSSPSSLSSSSSSSPSSSLSSSSDVGSTVEIFPTTENESVDLSSHFFTELSDVTIEKIPAAAPVKEVKEKVQKRDPKTKLEAQAESGEAKAITHQVSPGDDDFKAPETESNPIQDSTTGVLEPVTVSGPKAGDHQADDHNSTATQVN